MSEEKLESSAMWRSASAEWRCPGCLRRKREIIRRSRRGLLVAKIVEHHDHFHERAIDLLSELVPRELDVGLEIHWVARASLAFEQVPVCEDCNNTDGLAKRTCGLPAHCSFAPAQLRRFVVTMPGCTHRVDQDAMQVQAERLARSVEERERFVRQMADLIRDGRFWRFDDLASELSRLNVAPKPGSGAS